MDGLQALKSEEVAELFYIGKMWEVIKFELKYNSKWELVELNQ